MLKKNNHKQIEIAESTSGDNLVEFTKPQIIALANECFPKNTDVDVFIDDKRVPVFRAKCC